MQVSYSSLFVCFDLYPRHIAPALMLQRTPPQADQDRKDEPVFGAGILSRLRCKTAFLSRQKHDVKSGAFPLCQLQIGVDDDLKSKSDQLFKDLGTDTTSAIRMFLTQAVAYNGFPFEIKRTVHNPYTSMIEDEMLQRLEQSRESSKNGNYRNADDVISDMREK